jgi:hypothetical protein
MVALGRLRVTVLFFGKETVMLTIKWVGRWLLWIPILIYHFFKFEKSEAMQRQENWSEFRMIPVFLGIGALLMAIFYLVVNGLHDQSHNQGLIACIVIYLASGFYSFCTTKVKRTGPWQENGPW